MWVARTANELIAVLTDGTLPHESAAFEVKAQLPEPARNSDIPIDVAAMATDGGVIIYGVSENKTAVTFDSHPLHPAPSAR